MDQENVPLQGGVMKPMKFSEAILRGFEMVGGKQCKGYYCPREDDPRKPGAVCVLGARNLCLTGDATEEPGRFTDPDSDDFCDAWGIHPSTLNDEGMPWEHIYGMARAARV